jgi:hypothetical protein
MRTLVINVEDAKRTSPGVYLCSATAVYKSEKRSFLQIDFFLP